MDEGIFDPQVKQKGGASVAPPLRIIGIGVAVGAVVIGLLLWRVTAAPPPSPPAVASAPTTEPTAAPTVTPSPTPPQGCDPITSYLAVITDQEAQGKWEVAAQNILSLLSDKRLCEGGRANLEAKYVTDSLEAIYARTFVPDKDSQEEAVTAYQSIKQFALDHHLVPPHPLVVAQRATQTGKFLLAKTAYDEAYAVGSFKTSDMALVKDYVSNLYDIGAWWTKSQADYDEGLSYLSASRLVAEKYQTGQAEAWGLLRQLLGDHPARWPKPAATPLLE